MAPVTIKDVQVITTQPERQRLVVVKVITSEPGLYGLGCATFTQRFHAVVAAIDKHVKPFVIGRDVSRIDEMWQMGWMGQRLLAQRAGAEQRPVRHRHGAVGYQGQAGRHARLPASGRKVPRGRCCLHTRRRRDGPQEVLERVQQFQSEGYRYIRIQMGGYGGKGAQRVKPEGAASGAYFDARAYVRQYAAHDGVRALEGR